MGHRSSPLNSGGGSSTSRGWANSDAAIGRLVRAGWQGRLVQRQQVLDSLGNQQRLQRRPSLSGAAQSAHDAQPATQPARSPCSTAASGGRSAGAPVRRPVRAARPPRPAENRGCRAAQARPAHAPAAAARLVGRHDLRQHGGGQARLQQQPHGLAAARLDQHAAASPWRCARR